MLENRQKGIGFSFATGNDKLVMVVIECVLGHCVQEIGALRLGMLPERVVDAVLWPSRFISINNYEIYQLQEAIHCV